MVKKSADLEVRLARTRREVAAAQALRYRVFYKEMGASASLATWILQRDIDQYDRSCDHLLVLDPHRRGLVPWVSNQVVGTFRLMPRAVAERHGGFYSAGEYDLGPVLAWPGDCLELGRSCVDPEYRNRAVIDRLWTGIAGYVLSREIGLLFGCASLPGTRPEELADRLSYLHHFHLAPPELRPRAVAGRYVDMQRLPASAIDPRAAWAGLPPLLKGYLRLGAWVGDGAVVDSQFNTTDVCIVLQTEQVTRRYFRHYETRVRRQKAA